VQAVGYKEVVRFLKHEISLEECRDQVKQGSRRLAKKQMTWFTHDERIKWLSVDNYDNIFDLITDALKLIAEG
jgi:tRNA dimethylallyltransferase